MVHLTQKQAEGFYDVHKARPFFGDLVGVHDLGPLHRAGPRGRERHRANRELMGATDSKKAAPGTIRQKFGTDIEKNAAHGSDAPETAKYEIGFFFSGAELARLGVNIGVARVAGTTRGGGDCCRARRRGRRRASAGGPSRSSSTATTAPARTCTVKVSTALETYGRCRGMTCAGSS